MYRIALFRRLFTLINEDGIDHIRKAVEAGGGPFFQTRFVAFAVLARSHQVTPQMQVLHAFAKIIAIVVPNLLREQCSVPEAQVILFLE